MVFSDLPQIQSMSAFFKECSTGLIINTHALLPACEQRGQ